MRKPKAGHTVRIGPVLDLVAKRTEELEQIIPLMQEFSDVIQEKKNEENKAMIELMKYAPEYRRVK